MPVTPMVQPRETDPRMSLAAEKSRKTVPLSPLRMAVVRPLSVVGRSMTVPLNRTRRP